MNLSGKYPNANWIRELVLEAFDPAIHFDFGWANIIIQGSELRLIDFDDTVYPENPYIRPQRALEMHLKMKYK